ncbi:MAG TPA: amidohydrolase family protein [Candidatus Binatia bacterium]|nr:amidohydrolase family protein [Candidatus Binatia bacterium]
MTPRIVDGDAHLLETGDFVLELAEAHPGTVKLPDPARGIAGALIEGKQFPRSEGRGCGVDTPTSITPKATNPFEPAGILRDADAEGIDVMVAYPSLGIGATAFSDPAFAEDFCRRWNRWAARFTAAAPGGRLRAVGIVPLQDPARAVPVLEEMAAQGLVGVTVPPALGDGRNLDHPDLERFWAAVEASGLPVGVHGAPGMNIPVAGADRFDNYVQVHALSFPFDQMIALTALTLGGVLERHPRVRVAFLESGVGWVPYFLERLDEHVEKRGRQVPGCRRRPSEYAERGQCVFACEPEEHGIAYAAARLGADRIMYASDYPHWDSDFPDTVAPIRERPDLTADAKTAILGGTAARLYGV